MTKSDGLATLFNRGVASYIAASIVVMCLSNIAVADSDKQFVVNIPEQSTNSALLKFAEDSNIQVVLPEGIGSASVSPALSGRFTLDEVLGKLLADTGLVYEISSDNLVLIRKVGNNAAGSVGEGSAVGKTKEEGGKERELEEIIVTAQKREQRLEEVPVSIQAFSSEQLEDANLRDINEIITFVPGASEGLSANLGARRYQLRGIEQGSGSPTVGYYINDSAAFGMGYAPSGRAFDMERVEVLRGPQSTLYGNGAMGGVIRYITNAPNLNEVEASVRAGYSGTQGGDSSYYLDGALSLPIVEDVLGIRLVASNQQVGGYQEDLFGNSDVDDGEIADGRVSLLWQPSEVLSMKFLHSINESLQTGGTSLTVIDPPTSSRFPGNSLNYDTELNSLTMEYDFGFASLNTTTTKITLEENIDVSVFFPIPGGKLSLVSATSRKIWSNETRLVSQNEGPFQWLAGVFYTDTKTKSNYAYEPELFPPGTSKGGSASISYFGEFSWELLDGKLIPLVGVRYFEEEFTGDYVDVVLAGTGRRKQKFDNTNLRFNLSWLPSDNSAYFLNVAEGFRSGSLNNPGICDFHKQGGLPCEVEVDSDQLTSYELGTKQTLVDGSMLLEVALYFQPWENVRQLASFGGIFVDYQVGDAEVYGIDLSLLYQPSFAEGLSLNITANWNSAEFTSIANDALTAATGVERGDRLNLVPEWTFAVMANYLWDLSDSWEGLANLGFSHLSPQQGQFGTGAEGDSRNLLRARLGVQNGNFGAYLFGNNLLGENGVIYGQTPVGGFQSFTQDYPRQVGVEFTYDF